MVIAKITNHHKILDFIVCKVLLIMYIFTILYVAIVRPVYIVYCMVAQ